MLAPSLIPTPNHRKVWGQLGQGKLALLVVVVVVCVWGGEGSIYMQSLYQTWWGSYEIFCSNYCSISDIPAEPSSATSIFDL